MKNRYEVFTLLFASFVSINGEFVDFNVISEYDIFNNILNENSACTRDFRLILTEAARQEIWALQFLDSMTKIPSGLLKGNFRDTGSFEECITILKKVNNSQTRGKYCRSIIDFDYIRGLLPDTQDWNITLQFFEEYKMKMWASSMFSWSVCVPSSCNASDLNSFFSAIGTFINQDVPIKFDESMCQVQTDTKEFSTGAILTIASFAIILFLFALSSGYHMYAKYKRKPYRENCPLTSFSIIKNWNNVFDPECNKDDIPCLYGIKAISLMWVLAYYIIVYLIFVLPRNLFPLLEFLLDKELFSLLNVPLATDSFLLVTGTLISYKYMLSTSINQNTNLWIYYASRIIRCLPSVVAMVLVHLFLLEFMGSGPYWPQISQRAITHCKENWWSTLIFVQNYVNPEDICVNQTWYLAVDMQLFILSPIILYCLSKYSRATIISLILLMIANVFVVIMVANHFELSGILGVNIKRITTHLFLNYYVVATHTRAFPWLMGICLGYFVFVFRRLKEPIRFNKIVVLILWASSIIAIGFSTFSGHNLVMKPYVSWKHTLYLGLIRPGWSICVTWIIFACSSGHGEPFERFFSISFFKILSKLTYSMFLVGPTIILIWQANIKEPVIYSGMTFWFDFWGFYTLTFFVGLAWHLIFEAPFYELFKSLLTPGEPSNQLQYKNTKLNGAFE